MWTGRYRGTQWAVIDGRRMVARAGALLLAGGVVVYVLLVAAGLLLTRSGALSGVAAWDATVSADAVAARVPTLDVLTIYLSGLANTLTVIVEALLLTVVLRWWRHRWRESVAVLAAILGELFIFLLVTATVHRPRPPLAYRMDPAPPTSSFPSGHTGAAVALYGMLAVIVWRTLQRRRTAAVAVVLLCAAPVLVAWARVYRGMHYPSDVMAGAIAGALWLLVVTRALPLDRSSHDQRNF